MMDGYQMDPNKERTKLPHRWAGYMARADTDTEASRALRTRGLQWWRHGQTKHKSKLDGVTYQKGSLMLEVGSTDCSVQRIERWRIQATQRTKQGGYTARNSGK